MSDRPRASAGFYKGHGLGNDYLVVEEGGDWTLTPAAVARVCDRWRGIGADGIVLLLRGGDSGGPFRLRMFNPDGTEFERSGNGLRILASHLARTGRVARDPFEVEVGGDRVRMVLHGHTGGRYDVSVEMGRASVGPTAVAMDPDALDVTGRLPGPAGEPVEVVPVSVGNPHLVVWGEPLTAVRLRELGPFLTGHPALANGANVQLAEARARGRLGALIWERGVGSTTASGTSACAVAVAAARREDQTPGPVEVEMEGGTLWVDVSAELDVVLRGPVEEIMTGTLARDLLGRLDSV